MLIVRYLASSSPYFFLSDEQLEQECCYDKEGELTGGPPCTVTNRTKSRQTAASLFSMFRENVVPYLECCVYSDNCFKYRDLGMPVNDSRYIPPSIGNIWSMLLCNHKITHTKRLIITNIKPTDKWRKQNYQICESVAQDLSSDSFPVGESVTKVADCIVKTTWCQKRKQWTEKFVWGTERPWRSNKTLFEGNTVPTIVGSVTDTKIP